VKSERLKTKRRSRGGRKKKKGKRKALVRGRQALRGQIKHAFRGWARGKKSLGRVETPVLAGEVRKAEPGRAKVARWGGKKKMERNT